MQKRILTVEKSVAKFCEFDYNTLTKVVDMISPSKSAFLLNYMVLKTDGSKAFFRVGHFTVGKILK